MIGRTNTKRNTALYIIVCLMILFTLILFLGQTIKKYSYEIYQNIRESTTKSVEALTSDQIKMLDKTVTLLKIQAQTLASSLSAPELTVTPNTLKTFADIDDDYLQVVSFNADGNSVSSNGTLSKLSTDNEVYQKVFNGQAGITDTFLGAMGYEEVRVYAPIYNGGKIIGGVYIDLDAEILRSAGKGPLYDSSGYSYVLKQDGTILLAPAYYSYAQIYNNVRDVFLFSKNNQDTVDAFMKALENGESGNAVMDFSGETQIICFQPSEVKEGWYYVSVLPLTLVENNGQTVVKLSSRIIALFIAVILAFVVFLAVVLFFLLSDKWKQEINEGRVYKVISENINTAIFIIDQHTRYIRHTFENIYNILGVPLECVQGYEFSLEWLRQIGLPAEVAGMVENVDESSKPITAELKHHNPIMDIDVWLSVSVSPLNLKGRKEYMIAFTDITENKRLMEQLRSSMLEAQSASVAKSNFLANMSHDIRTPMNAITGMTDIAIRNMNDNARVLDCLKKISMSSRHLKGLINDILDMSKIESGKLSLNTVVTSLPEVMEGLANIVQFQAAEKEQRLFMIIKHVEHEVILCDSIRLNQVLLNILANAVKFTPNGGSVWCSVEESLYYKDEGHRQYIFSISDTGIGMSKEFQDTIFDTFTREKSAQIEKIEGSGLGMAISKWIVDQMGGTIQVFSEIGKGSKFVVTVEFPIVIENECSYTIQQELSLLLVDCDEQSKDNAEELLSEIGFNVESVCDNNAAIAAIDRRYSNGNLYDVIILNNNLPDYEFFESINSMRKVAKNALIVVAAGDYSEIREKALSNGADGVISPLFFKSTLFSRLSKLLLHKSDDFETLTFDRPLEGCRILLAEDNELNREIALELLSSSGAIVDIAENGKQCLEKFTESETDYYRMILMDIRMPIMNGYEATRLIRASERPDSSTVTILAVTADAFSEDIQTAKNAGMDGHISKPIDMTQVIAEIKRRL